MSLKRCLFRDMIIAARQNACLIISARPADIDIIMPPATALNTLIDLLPPIAAI